MSKIKELSKHIPGKEAVVLSLILLSLFIFSGCSGLDALNKPDFEGYTLIEVDGGDLSGQREPNVVVDIGFGDREYYAFTNEYGQLIKVTAAKIILQDDDNEPVLETGRYYPDEAKVPGVESPTLDEGHIIADSLGGVSNAYNITPQDSTLNRHGDQAYMEKVIRDAGGCTDFTAVITYPSMSTQIPSHYSFTYTLKGNVINDEFDNVNPDEVNQALGITSENSQDSTDVTISALDKKAEYIVIENLSANAVDLTGWKIVSVLGNQTFTFPDFNLATGASVKVGDSGTNSGIDFHWLDGGGTWNNSKSDPAELYDSTGKLVDIYND
ncbi:MAG: lamin tail domain-containing protein [Acetobacterium sp.]|nr:lamin tail domain-containing protein [Acetobacterium sp.]